MAGLPEKIYVLSFQSGGNLGGTELMNFFMLQCMDRNRFEIVVCFLDEEGPVSRHYREEGFEVVHLEYHRRPLVMVAWELFRLLKIRRFDIIHIYGLRANIIARIVGRLARCRNIVTSQHSIDPWRQWWQVWLDKLTSPWVSLYIPNTYAAAERLRRVERIPSDKLAVIHNGLDVNQFTRALPGRIRPILGVSSETTVITCVANFRTAKGHQFLLEAINMIRQRGISCQVWLVGDGKLRPAMETKAKSLGISNHVNFLGSRTDIANILSDSDIFVLPSLWEGMPGAIMEAMAARLPVVATHVGGVPELVVDGKTGILVPPQKSGALVSALEQLINDVDLRRRMGEAGHQHILSCFRLQDKVRQLEEVYSRLYRRSLHELQVFKN